MLGLTTDMLSYMHAPTCRRQTFTKETFTKETQTGGNGGMYVFCVYVLHACMPCVLSCSAYVT